MMSDENKNKKKKFIVLDVVFYGSSLNYDWGGGTNYQPLKKITKWDGRQYVLVSRYALRYSILNWANHLYSDVWKLADSSVLKAEKGDVVKLDIFKKDKGIDVDKFKKIFLDYPEFDFFGFMVAEKNSGISALTRTSPVKISHAISMTPYNLDTHTMANLGMMKRADPTGQSGSNPVNFEEKTDFYAYNITIDVNRVGKFLKSEHGNDKIEDIYADPKAIKERIISLVETVLNLKRDIKGRREDLSPWLIIVGLYEDGKYESYFDKITLNRKTHYKIKRTIKKEGETEIIENEIENGLTPTFFVGIPERENEQNSTQRDGQKNIFIFYRENLCDVKCNSKISTIINNKEEIVEEIKNFLENSK